MIAEPALADGKLSKVDLEKFVQDTRGAGIARSLKFAQ